MKTSFYFVIWIIIYPIIGLANNPVLDRNAFIVAFIFVWALSWLIRRSMPDTIRYEYLYSQARIMEDAYTGNVSAISRRITRQTWVEFVSALYFGATFVFVLYSIIKQNHLNDWIALGLFGLFAYGAITRASDLSMADRMLRRDASPHGMSVALQRAFHVDYDGYLRAHTGGNFEQMLPPRPPHFQAFRIFSLLMAIICFILGVMYLVSMFIRLVSNPSTEAITSGVMYFLYGSLAAYFGLRDTISLLRP